MRGLSRYGGCKMLKECICCGETYSVDQVRFYDGTCEDCAEIECEGCHEFFEMRHMSGAGQMCQTCAAEDYHDTLTRALYY